MGGLFTTDLGVEAAFIGMQAASTIRVLHEEVADRVGRDVRHVLHANLAALSHHFPRYLKAT